MAMATTLQQDHNSPMRAVSEKLRNLHISPKESSSSNLENMGDSNRTTVKTATRVPTSEEEKKRFKSYMQNDKFAESKFVSQDEMQTCIPDGSANIIRPVSNGTIEYGTVQRGRRALSGTTKNDDIAQYKQYFVTHNEDSNNNNNNNSKNSTSNSNNTRISRKKDPESDLIVNASLNDISGVPNTFKRYQDAKQANTTQKISIDNLHSTSDLDNSDPRPEAYKIFDNVLKNKRFKNPIIANSTEQDINVSKTRHTTANNTNTVNGDDNEKLQIHSRKSPLKSSSSSISSLSYSTSSITNSSNSANVQNSFLNSGYPDFNIMDGNPNKSPIPLIKPENCGLIFEKQTGVWTDKEKNLNEDISSSHAVDNSTSNALNSYDTSDLHKLSNTRDQITIESTSNRTEYPDETEYPDDTEIQPPLFNEKYLSNLNNNDDNTTTTTNNNNIDINNTNSNYNNNIQGINQNCNNSKGSTITHNNNNNNNNIEGMINDTQHHIANTTGISEVDISFQQSTITFISELINIMPHKQEWFKISQLIINDKSITNVVGLEKLMPQLLSCNLDNNQLESLQGIPSNVLHLSCSNNNLSNSNCSLEHLPNLETLNLSKNNISSDLSILVSCIHLKDVNLSNNRIRSLEGINTCQVKRLNLANNNISGTINFKDLINHSMNSFNCWSQIEELDLSDNQIVSIINISSLPKLRKLCVDNNPIEYLYEEEPESKVTMKEEQSQYKHFTNSNFKFKSNLEILSLLETSSTLLQIGNIPTILPFPHLKSLRIDGFFPGLNKLDSLPETLESLMINNGNMARMFDFHILPKRLERLRLNKIINFTRLPNNFQFICPLLKELNLNDNELDDFQNFIHNVPAFNLQELSIVNNSFFPQVRDIIEKDGTNVNPEVILKSMKDEFIIAIRMTCPDIRELIV
ncbi:Nud1p NDAI_0A08880 [Naumovozyma dairenensis CBS 421]|uniref:Uncharacterized protein n=1 Tax=Naumovozyma dairenensis (strain ATCC 10597 / BCRC 20456 / CBS 421 / NBRC 0211 / NRRL Y-12639) TaxID=1071378 RepID=G0W5F2_NAUDC|nr:hypothetical protein NDAI_0A08880 [Naumovozyma dairenensis CBS 421]CCD23040.1 hypothetical protein NDAI_0A08880 [Naumovozyma dairenensis CBS 421]